MAKANRLFTEARTKHPSKYTLALCDGRLALSPLHGWGVWEIGTCTKPFWTSSDSTTMSIRLQIPSRVWTQNWSGATQFTLSTVKCLLTPWPSFAGPTDVFVGSSNTLKWRRTPIDLAVEYRIQRLHQSIDSKVHLMGGWIDVCVYAWMEWLVNVIDKLTGWLTALTVDSLHHTGA